MWNVIHITLIHFHPTIVIPVIPDPVIMGMSVIVAGDSTVDAEIVVAYHKTL